MTRRLLLALLVPTALGADGRAEIIDLFASLAAALSARDAELFLKPFDRGMKDYGRLAALVRALLDQAEVASSVELIDLDESQGRVDLDWLLDVRIDQAAGRSERRRRRVTCTVAGAGKRRKITALDPVEFFAPPDVR